MLNRERILVFYIALISVFSPAIISVFVPALTQDLASKELQELPATG